METTAPNGRPVYLSLCGSEDDIQIDQAYYLDTPANHTEIVPDEVVDQIWEQQQDRIVEFFLEGRRDAAEAYADSLEDR